MILLHLSVFLQFLRAVLTKFSDCGRGKCELQNGGRAKGVNWCISTKRVLGVAYRNFSEIRRSFSVFGVHMGN